jgi:hypothetical protein
VSTRGTLGSTISARIFHEKRLHLKSIFTPKRRPRSSGHGGLSRISPYLAENLLKTQYALTDSHCGVRPGYCFKMCRCTDNPLVVFPKVFWADLTRLPLADSVNG